MQNSISRSARSAEPPLPNAEDVHMIVCDVDGTLMTSKHVLHAKTIDSIRYIRETRPNLPIIVSSGKQYTSCSAIRQQLDLDGFPASHAHGAIVYGPGGKLTHILSLPTNIVLDVCEYLRQQNLATFIFTEEECILVNREEGGKDWAAIGAKFDSNVEDRVDQRDEILETIRSGQRNVVKFSVCTETEHMAALTVDLATKYPTLGLTMAISFILELHNPDINKGTSLKLICQDLGISPSNVLAFGDGANDVAMFRVAKWSVAMRQGMQEAKDAAVFQGPTNDEGGVGVFLDRIFRPTHL